MKVARDGLEPVEETRERLIGMAQDRFARGGIDVAGLERLVDRALRDEEYVDGERQWFLCR